MMNLAVPHDEVAGTAGGRPSSRVVRMNLIVGLMNFAAAIASARATSYFF